MANEKRLIDGNKAQAVLVNMAEHLMEAGNPEMAGAVGYAAEVIGKQRTVDAVEVVHGEWFVIEDDYFDLVELKCSACGESWGFEDYEDCIPQNYHYCPNCGAKMDGGAKNA
jgi:hypothetical protein